MAQVTVTIDSKTYRMACEEGQEEHLSELASRFDRYVGHLKDQFGEIGDLRITVMAGIMVMDELHELQRRMRGLEAEVETLKKTRDTVLSKADKTDQEVSAALIQVTGKIEQIADKLAGRA
ncbi:MAG: cell division protein ZapA [Hoeflea sp.]|uniref:cell division protein ZapA n=1 Tax=Hoeflea sp. TaxID=1940281 RepID=UPI001D7A1100|nr:cell division protein ZapA [Hoeflea sp.]MBU4528280.1 cell division protein ZapA [Alphaproteobacteria bacterium]MBU4543876.1 cell division protein ZapA [Alphaproteobacteria bacterium]MBU4548517.1 cell division protein ZapA [Alphaproteobacteria bacterium]MBV1722596.1 cell division protein ZapA [Hoeflea sp.]MBV1762265.1 cell division protein ZapA [Hoeflea sp.]